MSLSNGIGIRKPMLYLFKLCLIIGLFSCNSRKYVPPSGFKSDTPLGPELQVTAISPTWWGVNGGTLVTITGDFLDTVNAVSLGGSECTGVTIVSSTQITCTITAHHAEVVNVVVQNSAGQSGTLLNGFSYNSFLYSANQATNSVSGFIVDSATGALTSVGAAVGAPAGAYGSEIDPTNRYYYTAGVGAARIGGYAINHGTGQLTAVPGSPFVAGSGVNGLVFTNDGKYLFATNWYAATVSSFSVNSSNGALTLVGHYAAGNNPGGVTLDPTDTFLYLNNYGSDTISGYTVGTDGTLAPMAGSPWATADGPDGIVMSSAGNFVYAGNSNASRVSTYSRDLVTGNLTSIGTYTIPNSAGGAGVIIDKSGSNLYATSMAAGKVSMFAINFLTGVLTPLSTPTVDAQVGTNDVRIQSLGRWVFTANTASNSVSAFIRNTATGMLTPATPPNFTVGNSPGIIAITDNVR